MAAGSFASELCSNHTQLCLWLDPFQVAVGAGVLAVCKPAGCTSPSLGHPDTKLLRLALADPFETEVKAYWKACQQSGGKVGGEVSSRPRLRASTAWRI